MSLLLRGALLCNDAHLEESTVEAGERTWRIVGDPTEGALVGAAAKAGLWRQESEVLLPRVAEIPFDSDRTRMSTVHQVNGEQQAILGHSPFVVFVKVAADIVLDFCSSVLEAGRPVPLTAEVRRRTLEANQAMAQQALRVLGVANRPLLDVPETTTSETLKSGLTFLGLLGMLDPARQEVKTAVHGCQGDRVQDRDGHRPLSGHSPRHCS